MKTERLCQFEHDIHLNQIKKNPLYKSLFPFLDLPQKRRTQGNTIFLQAGHSKFNFYNN